MKERYIQTRKAMSCLHQFNDETIPHFNVKTGIWSWGKGIDRTDSYNLEKIMQDFSGMKLNFHYQWHGEIIIRHVFADVLEDIRQCAWPDHSHTFGNVLQSVLYHPQYFTVGEFTGQYSKQQLALLKAVREKLLIWEKYHV